MSLNTVKMKCNENDSPSLLFMIKHTVYCNNLLTIEINHNKYSQPKLRHIIQFHILPFHATKFIKYKPIKTIRRCANFNIKNYNYIFYHQNRRRENSGKNTRKLLKIKMKPYQ